MKYYIIVNLDKENAHECAFESILRLQKLGQEIVLDCEIADKFSIPNIQIMSHSEALTVCDIVIAVGGDGTIIHAAIDACAVDKAIVGINSGRLGFLSQIEYPFSGEIEALVNGEYSIQERLVLDAIVEVDGHRETSYALNDIVIARNLVGSMIDIEVYRNGLPCADYRADGLIFSTPTGSTAYSLSAGGPIVDPAVDCILMTPICPHSLYDRCIILNPNDTLTVKLITKNSFPDANVAVDGVVVSNLTHTDTITITKSTQRVKFIHLDSNDFYHTMNLKFLSKS